ncbi:DUF998 domain-containing protein [Shewanella marisflavi]|uniref:DUF998 domain-containing protein n=1 Tax=Shewanella marisflavi TaxID=260364 RepID=UPI00200D2B3E|nr:DUF998 domain-containing protein [Shewanella marisflavi]MCL1043220.1 DUF998 domain-containing protein [Shewanella marisflavi]
MTSKEQKLSKLAFRFGLLGLVGHLIGLVVAVLGFSDYSGQGFSFYNFSLSELGQYGHSELAVVFNGGLFFGSLSLTLFALFALQNSDGPWVLTSFLLLVLSLFALTCVGLFPINVYHLHILGIEYFFYFSTLCVVLYLVYLLRHWRRPKRFALRGSLVLSLLTLGFLSSFILMAHSDQGVVASGIWFYQDMVMVEPRPDMRWPVMVEWGALLSYMLWLFSLVWTQRETRRIA